MKAADAAKLTPAERRQMSNHTPRKAKNRGSTTHGGKSQARAGWSVDDTEMAAVPTKVLPGKYRVTITIEVDWDLYVQILFGSLGSLPFREDLCRWEDDGGPCPR